MQTIIDWFTPAKRKAIYGIVAGAAVALVAFGFITQEQLDQYIQQASGIIAALATFMAFLNTSGK